MKERWQAGYNYAKIALGEPRVFELPHVTEAARIFDVASRLDDVKAALSWRLFEATAGY